jgi:hypothetical protein
MAGLLRKQLRHVHVTFTEPVEADFFNGVEGVARVEHMSPDVLVATVRSEGIDAVVKRVATRQVTDVEIERATLEDVFLEYYRGQEAEPDETPPDDTTAAEEGGDA